MKWITLTAVGMLLAVAGLQVNAEEAPGALQRTPSTEGAAVGFANLSDGDIVPPTFTVRFTINGMGIAPAGSDIDNTGHHHLLIDMPTPPPPPMDQPLPSNEHIMHFGKGQTEVELHLPEGQHTLQLLLGDYRHVPHDPPVMSDRITIEVAADAPPQKES